MTYLLNIDNARSYLVPVFAWGIDITFIFFLIAAVLCCAFRKFRCKASAFANGSLAVSLVVFLFALAISSYMRFFYYKSADVYVQQGMNIDLSLIHHAQFLKSEIHMYVGFSFSLFLLVMASVFRFIARCTGRGQT